jgi:hypothetical protein
VLSWTGTAQGRLNGGTYGSSGTITVTGWTAGTNLNVEFNTGTVGSVQLEKGSTATSFDYRPYGTELLLCQRYYEVIGGQYAYDIFFDGYNTAGSTLAQYLAFKATKRAAPTITVSGTLNYFNSSGLAMAGASSNTNGFTGIIKVTATGRAYMYSAASGSVLVSSEL